MRREKSANDDDDDDGKAGFVVPLLLLLLAAEVADNLILLLLPCQCARGLSDGDIKHEKVQTDLVGSGVPRFEERTFGQIWRPNCIKVERGGVICVRPKSPRGIKAHLEEYLLTAMRGKINRRSGLRSACQDGFGHL